jgi:hypothetical protein
MTKGEVAGLQALAKHHGTSLTTNPHTGLPEAFSLKSLVPMAAGFMLAGPVGMSAMGAGMTVGGAYTLATGSLKQGLIAGLGAYGGAGLGEGIAAGGSNSITGPGAGAGSTPLPEVADVGSSAGANLAPATPNPVAPQTQLTGTDLGSMNPNGEFAQGFQSGPVVETPYSATSTNTIPQLRGSTSPGGEMMSDMGQTGTSAQVTTPTQPTSAQSGIDLGGPGSGPANTGAPQSDFQKIVANAEKNPKLMAYATAPGIVEELTPKPYEPEKANIDSDMGQRLGYDSGYDNSVPGRTGQARYTQISGDEAKRLYGFADGGDVGYPGEPVVRMADGGAAAPSAVAAPSAGYEAGPFSGTGYSGYGAGNVGNYSGYDTPVNAGISAALPATPMATPGVNPNQRIVDLYARVEAKRIADEKAAAEAAAAKAAEEAAAAPSYDYGGGAANGGLMDSYAQGGSVPRYGFGGSIASLIEKLKAQGAFGDGVMMPDGTHSKYSYDEESQRYTPMAAGGGISDAASHLGGYSDGGRLLKGPGDGVSDSIPAVIGNKQPARLADGEFVVPARIVSEIGNGSTEAGARKLYAMMDRVQKARGKTVGKGKVAKNTRADKYLPA